MTNKIREARNLLANSWCRGSYKTNDPNGAKFCAVGAIAAVAYDENWEAADLSPEVHLLGKVIMEQYADRFAENFSEEKIGYPVNWRAWRGDEIVIAFNDDVAESHEEIMAVFDKAAVRLDEINALK